MNETRSDSTRKIAVIGLLIAAFFFVYVGEELLSSIDDEEKPPPAAVEKPDKTVSELDGTAQEQPDTTVWAPAVEPKPLSENVIRGLSWLAEHQLEGGGFGQGEESTQMGAHLKHLKDKPNLADTCAAALALLRAGNTPTTGDYGPNILAAVRFVVSHVLASDEKSLFVTDIRDTRLQMKLGTYIDTFMASLLLAEVKGKMPGEEDEKKVCAAIEKIMNKIEQNQKEDGTFGGRGWANALSFSMASKGVNRLAQSGTVVNNSIRAKLENQAQGQYDEDAGTFGPAGSAGVALYASAANLSAMQDSENTNKQQRSELEKKLKDADTDEERKEISEILLRYDKNEKLLVSAQGAVIDKLGDEQFIAGFGSNGGEEFLSYMNIGESLVVKGGDAWSKWDKEITNNLNRIQNKDGSWTGHHCITGRTFCTAAALLVLMTDRAPVPIVDSVEGLERFKK